MAHPDDQPDDDRIRSLLASLREDGPVPHDVARRLDARLAGLAPAPARRSWGRLFAVAAVLVIVGGIGIVTLRIAQGPSQGDSSASSADSSAQSPPEPLTETQSGSGSANSSGGGRTGIPVLTGATLRAEATTEFGRPGVLPAARAITGSCGSVDLRTGVERVVPVLYERRPAVLAAYAVQDGTRLVQVVGCSSSRLLAAVRVAAGPGMAPGVTVFHP